MTTFARRLFCLILGYVACSVMEHNRAGADESTVRRRDGALVRLATRSGPPLPTSATVDTITEAAS